jgi:hypothetical protein
MCSTQITNEHHVDHLRRCIGYCERIPEYADSREFFEKALAGDPDTLHELGLPIDYVVPSPHVVVVEDKPQSIFDRLKFWLDTKITPKSSITEPDIIGDELDVISDNTYTRREHVSWD